MSGQPLHREGREGRSNLGCHEQQERQEDLESFVAVAQSCSVRLMQACSMASFTKSKATSFTLSLGIALTRQQDKETSSQGSQPLNGYVRLGVGGIDKFSTSVFLEKILQYYYIPTIGVADLQALLNNMLRSS